jgi:hypothetical protein
MGGIATGRGVDNWGGTGGSFGYGGSASAPGLTSTATYGPDGNPNFPGTVAYNKLHGIATTPAAAPTGAGTTAPAGPGWGDISGYFKQALDSLTNDTEKTYQAGKRRTLADIAMQSVNSGMANTLNMPAAGVAYDEANRAPTNLALGNAKANILTGLGQTAVGVYGTNLGSQTSLQTAQIGANTSTSNAALGAGVDYAQQALQRYINELSNKTETQKANIDQAYKLGTGPLAMRY